MLRLIDPAHPDEGVQIDEAALRDLAGYVIARAFGNDWQSEARHDEHSYHDEPAMHPLCAHCAIYRAFNGNGYAVACTQLAFAILSAGGPMKYMQQRRLSARAS